MEFQDIKVNEEIVLKAWKAEFANDLFKLTIKNYDHLLPWLAWVPGVKTVEDSEKFVQSTIKGIENGEQYELGIWLNGRLVGCVGIHGVSKEHRRGAVGYWLDCDNQGRGIVTRSVQALINYSFLVLDLNRLELLASTENTNSFHIAEKLGFEKEGILRQYEFINNRFLDYFVYSLLKS